jgi:hypothetical protein
MSPRLCRRLALLDVLGVPLLVAWYIWVGQATAPRTWVILAVWLVASFLLQGDTPKTLGWRADNLGPATLRAAVVYGVFVAGLLAAGFALGAPRYVPAQLVAFRRLWNYFAFCLLQQVALNSFLNNRLMLLISNRWARSVLAGAIFGALHWPNPVLVPLTFVGGSAMAWLFARERNIIPLAVGQALLGSMVAWAFPVSWHHFLRVGPGYYRFPF